MKLLWGIFFFCAAAGTLFSAPRSAVPSGEKERISKESLLKNDKLFRYTTVKPCGLDKYKYFCCPVRKIVRRQAAEGKWTDYCYNGKDELIGIRKGDHRGTVKRSDFSAVSGCTQCRNSTIKQHSWKHNTKPKLAPAKKKKKRR